MNIKGNRFAAHAALIIVCLLWGTGFVFIKVVLRELPAPSFVVLRYTVVGICLGTFAAMGPMPKSRLSRKDVLLLVISAVSGTAFYQLLVSWGLERTNAATAGMLNASGPIFVLLLGAIFLGESLTSQKIIGITVALAGVLTVLLRGSGEASLDFSNLFGPLLLTAGMLAWTVCVLSLKPVLGRHPHVYVSTLNILVGSVILLPFLVTVDLSKLAAMSLQAWLMLAYLAIPTTIGAQFLYYYGLSKLDASQVMTYAYLLPFLNAATAAAVLGEIITVYLLLGGALIIAGVALANWSSGRSAVPRDSAREDTPRSV